MAPKPGTPKRAHIPRSLEHEANRFLWPTAYELLLKILRDCDAVGFTDAADDGLAALEYIAKAVLESADDAKVIEHER